MKIERSFDADAIYECMTHEKVWDACSDDGTVKKELYFPNMSNSIYWLKAEGCGFFMLCPQNLVTYEVHTLLPNAHGRALEAAESGMEWVFENTPCERIITNVPAFNRAALFLSIKSGMKKFGINEKSFKKNGILHDQIMLGISKEGA